MKKRNKGRDNSYLKTEKKITYDGLEDEGDVLDGEASGEEADVKIYKRGTRDRDINDADIVELEKDVYEEAGGDEYEEDAYEEAGGDEYEEDVYEEAGEDEYEGEKLEGSEAVSRTGKDDEGGDWMQDDSDFEDMEILYQEEAPEDEILDLDVMEEDLPGEKIVEFGETVVRGQRNGKRGTGEPALHGQREDNRRGGMSGVQRSGNKRGSNQEAGYLMEDDLFDEIDQEEIDQYDDLLEDDNTGNQGQKVKSSILLVGGVIVLLIVIAVLCFVIWKMGHQEPVGGSSLDGQAVQGTETAQGNQIPDSGSSAGVDGNQDAGKGTGDQTGSGAGDGQTGAAGGSQTAGGAGDGQTGAAGGAGTAGGSQTAGGAGEGQAGAAGGAGDGQTGTAGGSQNGGSTSGQPGNGGISESGQNGTDTIGGTQNNKNNIAELPGSGTAEQGQTVVSMTFEEVKDTVTAKEMTNLRSEPSTEKDNTVVMQLKNGQTVTRTGINYDTGWSRLDYEGQTLYAVSRFLTTDLTSKIKEASSNTAVISTDPNTVITSDGRTVTFTDCDDIVSPKMAVNLRGEPSTAQGNASIHVYLEYRNNVRRTGISEDTGWSRVEYNGEVLYAVTSYLYEPEETLEE